MGILDVPGLSRAQAAALYAPISVLSSQSSYPVPAPAMDFVTNFQTGHGFTSSGTATFDLNRVASDAVIGTQYVRVTTNGAAGGALITKQGLATRSIATGKRVAVLMRVSDTTKLGGVIAYLYTDASNSSQYRVDRYVNGRAVGMSNVWTWVYFTRADYIAVGSGAGADPANITGWRLRIADNSSGAVTVDVAAIATFDPTGIAAAGPIVTFTFDDGFLAHRTKAAPILGKRGWAGTAFPICSTTDGGGSNYMSKAQMRELQNIYRWEFGGHAYSGTIHNNTPGYPNYTDAEVGADILANIVWLQQTGLRWSGMFAWPGGGVDQAKLDIASQYYSLGRSSAEEPYSTPAPDRPMDIRSVSVNASRTGTDYQAYIDNAVLGKTWLVFRIHDILASGSSGGTQVDEAVFSDLCDRVATSGARVMTMGQVARAVAAGI